MLGLKLVWPNWSGQISWVKLVGTNVVGSKFDAPFDPTSRQISGQMSGQMSGQSF